MKRTVTCIIMYVYTCVVCMLSTCIYYSTFYLKSRGADCTRNGKVISLLTHLKHRVSISVFQSNSESSSSIYYQYLWMY